MKSKITILVFFNLFIFNALTAQTDSLELAKQIDSLPQTGKLKKVKKPEERIRRIFTLAVGTGSIFYPEEKYLDGTDRRYFENVNWIPMSFKIEHILSKRFNLGFTVNVINNQRIYDAIWKNYSTNKTEIHRFTIKQMRASFLCRVNAYFIRLPRFESYIGFGLGLSLHNQFKDVTPSAYEYGGSGETDFFKVIGMETSVGLRFFPLENIAIFAEGGLMQSLVRFGFSYRLEQ
jgi:hypothetical protein